MRIPFAFAAIIVSGCRGGGAGGAPVVGSGNDNSRPSDAAVAPPPTARFQGVELLVTCAGARPTGKRHPSYVFTFGVERVLEGAFAGNEYVSGELFHDFGAGQLMRRLEMSHAPVSCKHQGILKLVAEDPAETVSSAPAWRILWAGRQDEADSLRSLETAAHALVRAVELRDPALAAAHLAEPNGLSAAALAALHRAHDDAAGAGPFRAEVIRALITERDGVVQIGGGALPYSIVVTRDPAASWKIGAATWR